MDDDLKALADAMRGDAAGFAREVDAMRTSLEGPLAQGAQRAGQAIEGALTRAVRTGRLGFDELKSGALSALDAIAAAAVRTGASAALGGVGGTGGGGLAAALGTLLGGLPGRATGGPVTGGRPYLVGERGPELFVPTAAGRIEPGAGMAGPRDVRVAITVAGPADTAPAMLRQSSRQVARAVKAALAE